MRTNEKDDEDGNASPKKTNEILKMFHAMRNGKLYRSIDGITWQLEHDTTVSLIPEGTSRTTLIK